MKIHYPAQEHCKKLELKFKKYDFVNAIIQS